MTAQPKQARAKKRRPGKHALVLISALFLSSGLLRLGSGTGAAIAREVAALNKEDTQAPALSCEPEEGIDGLLAALKQRETRIDGQENTIQNRMLALKAAEAEYAKNLAALIAAEQALDATISRADSAAEADLGQLTAMYENMKPKDAAALFEEMNPDFSAGFLGRMRPDAAAAVLAGLKPETAYAVSVILAGRNANVPRTEPSQ
jgi:flagellar motility protein MotE (MotC chaperone)